MGFRFIRAARRPENPSFPKCNENAVDQDRGDDPKTMGTKALLSSACLVRTPVAHYWAAESGRDRDSSAALPIALTRSLKMRECNGYRPYQ